jgi:hypothetical protein
MIGQSAHHLLDRFEMIIYFLQRCWNDLELYGGAEQG